MKKVQHLSKIILTITNPINSIFNTIPVMSKKIIYSNNNMEEEYKTAEQKIMLLETRYVNIIPLTTNQTYNNATSKN
jgi:hypothetical protein